MDDITDVITFLSPEANPIVRGATVEYLLGLSGTPTDGSKFFIANLTLLKVMECQCYGVPCPD
jgi:hypothetical protein